MNGKKICTTLDGISRNVHKGILRELNNKYGFYYVCFLIYGVLGGTHPKSNLKKFDTSLLCCNCEGETFPLCDKLTNKVRSTIEEVLHLLTAIAAAPKSAFTRKK